LCFTLLTTPQNGLGSDLEQRTTAPCLSFTVAANQRMLAPTTFDRHNLADQAAALAARSQNCLPIVTTPKLVGMGLR
jgi:hypothetical protein